MNSRATCSPTAPSSTTSAGSPLSARRCSSPRPSRLGLRPNSGSQMPISSTSTSTTASTTTPSTTPRPTDTQLRLQQLRRLHHRVLDYWPCLRPSSARRLTAPPPHLLGARRLLRGAPYRRQRLLCSRRLWLHRVRPVLAHCGSDFFVFSLLAALPMLSSTALPAQMTSATTIPITRRSTMPSSPRVP